MSRERQTEKEMFEFLTKNNESLRIFYKEAPAIIVNMTLTFYFSHCINSVLSVALLNYVLLVTATTWIVQPRVT